MRKTRVSNCFTARKHFMQLKVFIEVSEFKSAFLYSVNSVICRRMTRGNVKRKTGVVERS